MYDQMTDSLWIAEVENLTMRAKKRYWWIPRDEIFSEALLAVVKAVRRNKHPEKCPLHVWIYHKGFQCLIDGLRTTSLLPRRGHFRSVEAMLMPFPEYAKAKGVWI